VLANSEHSKKNPRVMLFFLFCPQNFSPHFALDQTTEVASQMKLKTVLLSSSLVVEMNVFLGKITSLKC